jgi:hypothetical protein
LAAALVAETVVFVKVAGADAAVVVFAGVVPDPAGAPACDWANDGLVAVSAVTSAKVAKASFIGLRVN